MAETPNSLGRPSGWAPPGTREDTPDIVAKAKKLPKEDCPEQSKIEKTCGLNMLIYFGAAWCEPCKVQKKYIDQLKKDGYIVYKIDVTDLKNKKNQDFAESHGVFQVPTMLVRENCKTIHRFQGIVGYKKLAAVLKKQADQKPKPKPVPKPDYDPKLSTPQLVDYSL